MGELPALSEMDSEVERVTTAMKTKSTAWSGLVLILIGAIMGVWGLNIIEEHGNVSGGPIIWVMFFGGSLLFIGCGIYNFCRSK